MGMLILAGDQHLVIACNGNRVGSDGIRSPVKRERVEYRKLVVDVVRPAMFDSMGLIVSI